MSATSRATSSAFEALRNTIGAKTATVGIVGLGYVGWRNSRDSFPREPFDALGEFLIERQ